MVKEAQETRECVGGMTYYPEVQIVWLGETRLDHGAVAVQIATKAPTGRKGMAAVFAGRALASRLSAALKSGRQCLSGPVRS